MTTVRGFEIPETLYYVVGKHVWVRPVAAERVEVGMTPVFYQLLRNSLVAITVRTKTLGQIIAQGRNIAMIESMKYNGPLPAPLAGVVLRLNEALTADVNLAARDPYGAGWIVEMQPTDWGGAQGELLTGDAALQAYGALLEAQGLSKRAD